MLLSRGLGLVFVCKSESKELTTKFYHVKQKRFLLVIKYSSKHSRPKHLPRIAMYIMSRF